ncbi:MAG: hypothetical protein MJ202_07680 [Lentisphaeria bacterium]|nr:hypothetical protein [Lentisphaeria bacterium]
MGKDFMEIKEIMEKREDSLFRSDVLPREICSWKADNLAGFRADWMCLMQYMAEKRFQRAEIVM